MVGHHTDKPQWPIWVQSGTTTHNVHEIILECFGEKAEIKQHLDRKQQQKSNRLFDCGFDLVVSGFEEGGIL